MPIANALPYGLVNAPDGSIFMAELGTNHIGRINASSGALHQFTLPDGARPRRLAVDAKGIVWYSDFARGFLGRLDPASGTVQEFQSPGGASSGPYGIALGPDGRVWYDESAKSTIVAFDYATKAMTTTPIPTRGAIVRNMSVDSARGRVWLALSGTQRLGEITTH
jgi:virginiamycin B lyase